MADEVTYAPKGDVYAILRSISKHFDTCISVVSLERPDGEWDVFGDIDASVTAKLPESKLFKVLLRRVAPLVILDAQLSSLTCEDVMVTEGPQLRLYVEATLHDEDKCVGALILADQHPRAEFTASEKAELSGFARLLESYLRPVTAPRSLSSQESDRACHPLAQPKSLTSLSVPSTSPTVPSYNLGPGFSLHEESSEEGHPILAAAASASTSKVREGH
eukprot:TRINITY_DN66130_c0_g1_i1.p1 TRINITY_DN66130_c0_g1~~TRINITY_DN66130_c0_g1_i1.p1  ORF type:complete len:229 (-),score=30.17 TRINITY_DN66130_c0_g1_i1:53-709(-)